MDITRAREIIAALAEGVDPTTGEVLPDGHLCNKGEVVRALYVALDTMTAKPKRNQPENAGKPWSAEDEYLLKELYESGAPKKEICQTLKRSVTSVAARLVRMGLIDNRDAFRDRA